MKPEKDFKLEESAEPAMVPKRVAFVKKETSALVQQEDHDVLMSYPDLLWRLLIGFEILVIVLALISLAADAPLEELANPQHTPNPAKAPWYFLGLQELLHLFPPLVAGVVLPMLVVVALIVIPYFDINIKRAGMWQENRQVTFVWLTAVVATLVVGLAFFEGIAIIVPTLMIYVAMILPYFMNRKTGVVGWFDRLALAEWVMTWFVLVAATLTLIGILFRGPGWEWTWPWHGVY